MTQDHTPDHGQLEALHHSAAIGTLADLQRALQDVSLINTPWHAGKTALMLAIRSGDIEKVQCLIEHGADPELADDSNYTPLSYAVDYNFPAAVKLLLDLGVDRGYQPKYPPKPRDTTVYQQLNQRLKDQRDEGVSEEDWQRSQQQVWDLLEEHARKHPFTPVIQDVTSLEVLRLFLAAGDDLNQAPRELQREYIGLPVTAELCVTAEDYQAHKSPEYGRQNPEPMNFPFWRDMVRTGVNAWSAKTHFADDSTYDTGAAIWCFDRFGSSVTPLPDGLFVQIGGEHEDYSDPDFYIYNDVVIHDGQGEFQILGYPRDVFPPTDFHSATLVDEAIYLIGCLGYTQDRCAGTTPVFRLDLETWQIHPVKTSGEMPGWISRHRARLDQQRRTICLSGGEILGQDDSGTAGFISNPHRFELNLADGIWSRTG